MKKIECPWCENGLTPTNAYCGNCQGTGRVIEGSADEACHHQMAHVREVARCVNLWECVICTTQRTVDST